MMYSCYKCKEDVPEEHFTADDGRILCEKCSKNVIPASTQILLKLKKYDEK